MGTIWLARMRYSVPMLFSLAFFFNFLIGGLSGIFLSDVPSDVTTHGSFFTMAHFHYTIMGGLVFAFFAATYYWLPKMTGIQLNETLAKIHFWTTFVFFNLTFFPLFAAGFLDMVRRGSVYPSNLETLNQFVSASAFCLGISMLVFLVEPDSLARLRARAGRAEPVALARPRVAGADAGAALQLRRDPRDHRRPLRLRRPGRRPGRAARARDRAGESEVR